MIKVGDLVVNTETVRYPPGIVIQASTDSAEVVVIHFNGDKIIWSHTVLRVLE
jgi:hypothetical protein